MATNTKRWMRRYENESDAIEAARRYSGTDRAQTYYVIESPHRDNPEAGRWVVDTDGMVMNYERLVATYENGKPAAD